MKEMKQIDAQPKDPLTQRLDDISTIVAWTGKMYEAGLMPQPVAEACARHFGGLDVDVTLFQ
jgi:hypothetical protein